MSERAGKAEGSTPPRRQQRPGAGGKRAATPPGPFCRHCHQPITDPGTGYVHVQTGFADCYVTAEYLGQRTTLVRRPPPTADSGPQQTRAEPAEAQ